MHTGQVPTHNRGVYYILYTMLAAVDQVGWRSTGFVMSQGKLTHGGLVMPQGDIDPGQHCLGQWFVAWRHQTITWINVDMISMSLCGIQLRPTSQEVLKLSIGKVKLKLHI